MALLQGAAGRSSSSPSQDGDTGEKGRSSPKGPAVFTNKTRGGITGWGFRKVNIDALRAELAGGEQEDSEDAIGRYGSTTEAYGVRCCCRTKSTKVQISYIRKIAKVSVKTNFVKAKLIAKQRTM